MLKAIVFCLVLFSLNPVYTETADSQEDWHLSSRAVFLDNENIGDIIGKERHVLVNFFSPFSAESREIAPEFEKLVEEYMGLDSSRDDVVIAMLNGWNYESISDIYGVSLFPELVFFYKDSSSYKKYTGEKTAEKIIEFINTVTSAEVDSLDSTPDDSFVFDTPAETEEEEVEPVTVDIVDDDMESVFAGIDNQSLDQDTVEEEADDTIVENNTPEMTEEENNSDEVPQETVEEGETLGDSAPEVDEEETAEDATPEVESQEEAVEDGDSAPEVDEEEAVEDTTQEVDGQKEAMEDSTPEVEEAEAVENVASEINDQEETVDEVTEEENATEDTAPEVDSQEESVEDTTPEVNQEETVDNVAPEMDTQEETIEDSTAKVYEEEAINNIAPETTEEEKNEDVVEAETATTPIPAAQNIQEPRKEVKVVLNTTLLQHQFQGVQDKADSIRADIEAVIHGNSQKIEELKEFIAEQKQEMNNLYEDVKGIGQIIEELTEKMFLEKTESTASSRHLDEVKVVLNEVKDKMFEGGARELKEGASNSRLGLFLVGIVGGAVVTFIVAQMGQKSKKRTLYD